MTNSKKKFFNFFICIFFSQIVLPQSYYISTKHKNIYSLLDELASEKIINLNSLKKPYSKKLIIKKLNETKEYKIKNSRLKEDLIFYLQKHEHKKNKKIQLNTADLRFEYSENKTKLIIKPIWGFIKKYNKNGSFQHLYGGIEAELIIDNNWIIYSNLRDNTMSEPIALPDHLTTHEGGNYKLFLNNDYSEMRGGIIFNFEKGSIELLKEKIEWGENYFGSNIFSARTPSFPMIKFDLNINERIEFRYFHAWLFSEDVDSSKSYILSSGDYRAIYRSKYIAANMLSYHFTKHTTFSLGNSIIYGDVNGPHLAYLIPVFLYKSIDHSLNHGIENQNSQLFINISTREINQTHLYSSIFIDEFKKDRLFDRSRSNFISFKIGTKISNWPIKNIFNTIEYNKTNPMTYQHPVAGTTFESNQINLGHYMRDNSKVINYELCYKLKKRIQVFFEYIYAMHADDIEYSYNNTFDPSSVNILENKTWDNRSFKFKISKEIRDKIYITFEYMNSLIKGYDNETNSADYYLNKFTPEFYRGNNNTFSTRIEVGF